MDEEGQVIEIKGSQAKVAVERRQSCGDNCACARTSGGTMRFLLDNTIGAKVGDRVKFQLTDHNMALGATIVFGVPVVGLFMGYFAGQLFARQLVAGQFEQGLSLFGAILGVLGGFVVIRLFDRRIGADENSRPRLLEVVSSGTGTPLS